MKKERLQELAGIQLNEGYEEDSLICISVEDRKMLKKLVSQYIDLLNESGYDDSTLIKTMFDFAKKMEKRL